MTDVERSKSGQQNRPVFLDADFVCYVEGGGGTSDAAFDVTFWNHVFSSLRPDLRIHLAPRGGKPILEAIAQDIITKNIDKTLVAIDTDYDDFTGQKISDRRILYTYGYSWENDVLHFKNLELAYCALAHCARLPTAAREHLQAGLASLSGQLKLPVRADYFALRGGASVFPRNSPGRIVSPQPLTGAPVVRRDEVLKLCCEANRKTRPRAAVAGTWPVDVLRYCVGHIIFLATAYLVKASLRAHYKKASISTGHLQDIVLQTFRNFLHAQPHTEVVKHHAAACAAIEAQVRTSATFGIFHRATVPSLC